MFKGILPSKRMPSTEFTMVTSLGDISNGKENVPDPVPAVPAKPSKVTVHKDKAKHEKSKSLKALQDFTVEPVVTNQAFDKLLVGEIPSESLLILTKKMNRMICKFHPPSVQSLPTWTLR